MLFLDPTNTFPISSSPQLPDLPARNTRLQNLSITLVLLRLPGDGAAIQSVPHTATDAFLQRYDRPVAQSALRLVDVEVPRDASVRHALRGQRRLAFPQQPEYPLEHHGDEQAEVARQCPGGLRVGGVAHLGPAAAREVEEVDRLVVGDQEGFTVDALVLKGNGAAGRGALVGCEERGQCQVVRVRNVGDFGVVEEVLVVAQLELGLAAVVGGQHGREQLDVAGAEHGAGPDGGGEEVGVGGGAVGGEDVQLCLGFGGGVVLRLVLAHDDRVGLVGADEIGAGVVNDAGRAGVHEGFDARLL